MNAKDEKLTAEYWNLRYQNQETGWDMGHISPPLKAYFDTLRDKNIRILIPGCGNSHEADYLSSLGFANITVLDIAPLLVEKLLEKYAHQSNIKVILADFFKHQGQYDLIIEQTFFCALQPSLRGKYAAQMANLLAENGQLVGLWFDKVFEKEGPPFGGNRAEYQAIFEPYFTLNKVENCNLSHPARQGHELWMEMSIINGE